MLSLIRNAFRKLFGGTESATASTTELVNPPAKLIPHEWPFPSPEPPNLDYLLGEMIRGVEVEGDHVFYFYEGVKRRHLRTTKGTETILARHIVWWMEGRKYPKTAKGVRATCGEDKCIKVSHLALNLPQIPEGPEPKPVQKEPRKAPEKKDQKPVLEKLDRTKCPTAKGYFATKGAAQRRANAQNNPAIRGTGRKVYPYDTPCPYCFGYHLTKIRQSKYNPKKVGSW